MKFVPHEYQRYCTEYIKTHPVAALFLDMGLGKTVITLSAIEDLMLNTFEVNKVLIIAPLRVARDTWTAEIEKWDHLKYRHFCDRWGCQDPDCSSPPPGTDLYHQPGKYQVVGGILREKRNAVGFQYGRDR